MKKRVLALVLAGVLSWNMGVNVFAAEEIPVSENVEMVTEEPVSELETVMQEPDENYTGWWNDGKNDFYYENGTMIENCVYVIDDVWYMFEYDGRLLRNRENSYYNSETDERKTYRSDENGVLISGWYEDYNGRKFYSHEEYYEYEDIVFEDEGNLYYVDFAGDLVRATNVFVDGVMYLADENGVLTVIEQDEDGWVIVGEKHYLVKDGELIKKQMYTMNGKTYYFEYDGVMVTGNFEYRDPEDGYIWKMADSNGVVLEYDKQWYKYGENWYYFEEPGRLASRKFLEINGKTYHFGYYAEMTVGSFDVYDPERGEWIYYVTDENGVVQDASKYGWVKAGNKWYYYEEPGVLASSEFKDIGGKRYYFDWYGVMQTGLFWYYDDDIYYADPSGALARNQWIRYQNEWYYASDDYTICRNGIYLIGGQKYAFDYDGKMLSGKLEFVDSFTGEKSFYLTNPSGAIMTGKGWKYYDLYYYYTDEEGKLYTGQWTEDGHYYLDQNGEMLVGTHKLGGHYYYFDSNGYYREDLSSEFKGWKFVDGYWYYHDQNGKPYTGWLDDTYFIKNGVMQTESFVRKDLDTYYVRYDGKCVKNGWYLVKSKDGSSSDWIYANPNGTLVESGLKEIGGKEYYFKDKKAVRGVVAVNGKAAIFDENCARIPCTQTGWINVQGEWYYIKPNGVLIDGPESAVIDGETFYFKKNGVLRCNEVIVDEDTDEIYYLDSRGHVQTFKGWEKIQDEWYYADEDGRAVSGLQIIDGTYYLFEDGCMLIGNQYVEEWDGYYLFGASGAYKNVFNGWVSVGELWYYFKDGKALMDTICNIGGTTYAFDVNGVMAVGPYRDYLFAKNGALVRNSWCQMTDGTWYYADAYGRYVYGQRWIDGKTYWFDDHGRMLK